MLSLQVLFLPLERRRVRQLWIANFISNLGSWGQTFTLSWQVTDISHSPAMSALVQAIIWLPMVLLALPIGILADQLNKQKILFFSNIGATVCALLLCVLNYAEHTSVAPMLLVFFFSSLGNAITLPIWQSSIAELVEPNEYAALASLNNLSFNIAACLAPALARCLIPQYGSGTIYLFNAASFVYLVALYYQSFSNTTDHGLQQGIQTVKQVLRESVRGASSISVSHDLMDLLCNVFIIYFLTSSLPSLLPLFQTQGGTNGLNDYGTRLSAFYSGAIAIAFFMPYYRRFLKEKTIMQMATICFGLLLAVLSQLNSTLAITLCMGLLGAASSCIVTSFNYSILLSSNTDFRSRSIGLLVLITAIAQAAGSFFWGQFATLVNIDTSFLVAGIMLFDFAVLQTFRTKLKK